MRKKLCIGIAAHVDAGKTTLSEQILFQTKAIKDAGRVDYGDTHLDTDSQERARGITIFSSQASFAYKNTDFTLIDTPGHVDFAAETERALWMVDVCVLLISASQGISSHTRTLWRLLDKFNIPVFIFFNKMDIAKKDNSELIAELTEAFGEGFLAFSDKDGRDISFSDELNEEIALYDEALMNKFLADEKIESKDVEKLISKRRLFPVYFGTALNNKGVEALLDGLCDFTDEGAYGDEFAARVYKIATDDKGMRLTFLKLMGGEISIRMPINGKTKPIADDEAGQNEEKWTEKITGIRKYSGNKYENKDKAWAGEIVAVTGLSRTFSGQALGACRDDISETLVPVISYRMGFEGNISHHEAYGKIKSLEDEMPEISLEWDAAERQIKLKLVGAIQTEILTGLIHDRFGYVVYFDKGRIAYKETINNTVEGVGHFEPLRHYAEVHLRLEPQERGSGLTFDIDCPDDVLAKNWQRLILTHLKEKNHKGVLIGAPITDMKITVIAGKAHAKHTEGGDFRQATYRAVRQGLMKADSVLLEPYYSFTLELPTDKTGRAMADIEAMSGKCNPPEINGNTTILRGVAPVACMYEYSKDVSAYTSGEGKLSLSMAGYFACHDAQNVIDERGYDAENDVRNPSSSVFCTHGAGFLVSWDEVENYMHIEGMAEKRNDYAMPIAIPKEAKRSTYKGTLEEDKELLEIFERQFGPIKRKRFDNVKIIEAPKKPATGKTTEDYLNKNKKGKKYVKNYLLVDGYNVIHSWEDLKELAKDDLSAARGTLCDILCDYGGYTSKEVIVVFDAYKVSGGIGSVNKYNNIFVIYTKEAETADAYIEKATHEIAKEHNVTVVSSDGMVQLIVFSQDAMRLSSREFLEEIKEVKDGYRRQYLSGQG